jgi:hypothetical protein
LIPARILCWPKYRRALYEPVLHLLIRSERRGQKRSGWRTPKPAN